MLIARLAGTMRLSSVSNDGRGLKQNGLNLLVAWRGSFRPSAMTDVD